MLRALLKRPAFRTAVLFVHRLTIARRIEQRRPTMRPPRIADLARMAPIPRLSPGSQTLRAVAAHVRASKDRTAWSAPRLPSDVEKAERVTRIEAAADALDELAARGERVSYREFEVVLGRLHDDGMHPEPQLVSAVAFALHPEG